MAEAAKSLEDQLKDQKQQLEDNIRQTEAQMSRLKEQYLKVLGALEFAAIQKQETEVTADDSTPTEDVTS
tara:strand:+ start:124 stop:333 length:210 start_codon:yes stop_codon:yes gene_type:complete